MEEVKNQGLAKSIGVSNYLPEHLDAILENCTIPPAINQVRRRETIRTFLRH